MITTFALTLTLALSPVVEEHTGYSIEIYRKDNPKGRRFMLLKDEPRATIEACKQRLAPEWYGEPVFRLVFPCVESQTMPTRRQYYPTYDKTKE